MQAGRVGVLGREGRGGLRKPPVMAHGALSPKAAPCGRGRAGGGAARRRRLEVGPGAEKRAQDPHACKRPSSGRDTGTPACAAVATAESATHRARRRRRRSGFCVERGAGASRGVPLRLSAVGGPTATRLPPDGGEARALPALRDRDLGRDQLWTSSITKRRASCVSFAENFSPRALRGTSDSASTSSRLTARR